MPHFSCNINVLLSHYSFVTPLICINEGLHFCNQQHSFSFTIKYGLDKGKSHVVLKARIQRSPTKISTYKYVCMYNERASLRVRRSPHITNIDPCLDKMTIDPFWFPLLTATTLLLCSTIICRRLYSNCFSSRGLNDVVWRLKCPIWDDSIDIYIRRRTKSGNGIILVRQDLTYLSRYFGMPVLRWKHPKLKSQWRIDCSPLDNDRSSRDKTLIRDQDPQMLKILWRALTSKWFCFLSWYRS